MTLNGDIFKGDLYANAVFQISNLGAIDLEARLSADENAATLFSEFNSRLAASMAR